MKHGILAISEQEVQNIENWLGTQLDLVVTTWNDGQWGLDGITWTDGNKRAALQRVFGETDRQLVTVYEFSGVPLNDYSDAANGAYDTNHRQFAQELVDIGMEDTIIRPSHEFNLSWSSRYPNDPANYAEGLARVVREMQSVDGANFTFTFSPAKRRLGVAPDCWPVDAPSWPSGEEPPLVTPTIYDKWHGYPDGGDTDATESEAQQAWANDHFPAIQLWEDFATERGARMGGTFEWGCMGEGTPQPGESGGDNPYYIRDMIEYGESNGWAFQTYWNNNHHTIYPRSAAGLERSSDEFKTLVNQYSDGSGTNDGSQTSDPSTNHSYGGYNQPEIGTIDWHVPLNENFQDIEADIKDLAARIDELE